MNHINKASPYFLITAVGSAVTGGGGLVMSANKTRSNQDKLVTANNPTNTMTTAFIADILLLISKI